MTNIELSNYVPFMNEFIAALFLPHAQKEFFPTIAERLRAVRG